MQEDWITQSWDTAIKAKTHHDASVCITFRYSQGVHYMQDVLLLRAEYPDLKRAIIDNAKRFMPCAILIEDKASGQSLLQDLRRESTLPLIAIMPKGDKIMRAARVSPMIEAGVVALPEQAPWLRVFEAELAAFPHGVHDDQVDALVQYLGWVRDRQAHSPQMRRL